MALASYLLIAAETWDLLHFPCCWMAGTASGTQMEHWLFLTPEVCHAQASAAPDPLWVAGPADPSGTGGLVIVAASGGGTAAYSDCGTPSAVVHSRYERHLQDLPWQGRPVTLRIQARRLRCQNPDCQRKTFAERLVEGAAVAARRTRRLDDLQRHLGLALPSEADARLAARLAVPISADTLLPA